MLQKKKYGSESVALLVAVKTDLLLWLAIKK